MVIGNNAFGDLRGDLRGSGLFFIHCDTRNMEGKMSDGLVKRLRELAQAKHDDLSIGDEAADRIAELEAALLNLIEHTLDCELELDKLHGLGNGAGAGMSSVLCEAHATLEGVKQ